MNDNREESVFEARNLAYDVYNYYTAIQFSSQLYVKAKEGLYLQKASEPLPVSKELLFSRYPVY